MVDMSCVFSKLWRLKIVGRQVGTVTYISIRYLCRHIPILKVMLSRRFLRPFLVPHSGGLSLNLLVGFVQG